MPTDYQIAEAKSNVGSDALLLFRLGDFYEAFHDDAVVLARTVGLTLTESRGGQRMSGFPSHQLEAYLRKLVAGGHRVAVCEKVA